MRPVIARQFAALLAREPWHLRARLPADHVTIAQALFAGNHQLVMKSTIGRPRALTQEQVDLILAWHDAVRSLSAQRKSLKTLRQLAQELGVPPATAYNVIRRRGAFKQPPRDRREAEVRGQPREHGSKRARVKHKSSR